MDELNAPRGVAILPRMARLPASRVRASRGTRRDEPNLVDLILYVSASSRYAQAAQRNCKTLLDRFDPRQVKFEVCDVGAHPEPRKKT